MICNTFHTYMGTPHPPHFKPTFYGTATIGTKGQIVIPAEAREDLGFNTGDKVMVIGIKEKGMVGICKLESVEQMFAQMSEHLESMRKMIDKSKEEKGQ